MRFEACLLLLVAAVFSFTACDGGGSPTDPGGPLTTETIVKTTSSGFPVSTRLVIRTDEEWQDAWQTLYAEKDSMPALPAVDFTQSVVVLAAAGQSPNLCYDLVITGAEINSGGGVDITVTENVPASGCICFFALTYPVHVVRVDRFGVSPSFREATSNHC